MATASRRKVKVKVKPKARRAPRQTRVLSPAESRIKDWIAENWGVLSEIAKETELSVAFVQRIAYNREAQSREFRVERMLLERGCPLIQKIDAAA